MKEQRIVIEIDADGGVSADAEGFTGEACLRELDRLLEGLAASPSSVTPKNDGGPQLSKARTQPVGRKR